jgi:arylformamidase
VSLGELVEQVRRCGEFLFRRHGRPLLATGHSAGGHLAAMLMATDWAARGLPKVVPAGLPISGLFDLAPLVPTSLNAALGLDGATARALSPMLLPPPGGRLHAVVGAAEGAEYTRQSREMAAAWGGTWEALPGTHHFTAPAGLADPDSGLVRRALDLLPPAGRS